jgi:hypothetical protein
MKNTAVIIVMFMVTLGKVAQAFHLSPTDVSGTTLLFSEAPQSRKAFIATTAVTILLTNSVNPRSAFAMGQELITDPTEQWETGSPTPTAEAARVARMTTSRSQMSSNFAPQKRLTLERKSPAVRVRQLCNTQANHIIFLKKETNIDLRVLSTL